MNTPLNSESLVDTERHWTPPVQVDLRQIYPKPQSNPWQQSLIYTGEYDMVATRSMLVSYLAHTYDLSHDGSVLLVERLLAEHAIYEVDGRLTLTPPKRAPLDLWLVAGLVVAVVLGVILLWSMK